MAHVLHDQQYLGRALLEIGVKALRRDDLEAGVLLQRHGGSGAETAFDHAHLTEKALRFQGRQQLLLRRAVIGIDAHLAPEDIVHAIGKVALLENDLALFESFGFHIHWTFLIDGFCI